MRRYILTLLVFSVCIVSAIGNQQTKSTGEIIIDGKKMNLPYAYCLKQDDFYQVIMLNHKLPEKDITNMFRNYPDDEIKISLMVPIVANPAMNGIAVDEYIASGVKLSMKAKPAKKGDAVEVTVSESHKEIAPHSPQYFNHISYNTNGIMHLISTKPR